LGHANRPRLHDALGLDAQPRRLCLSSGWSRHPDTNANRNTYGHGNTNSYSDANKYAFKAYSDAETSPDASAASVSAASNVIGDR
jgi:hypothetical protein